jgi:hypothetical protein
MHLLCALASSLLLSYGALNWQFLLVSCTPRLMVALLIAPAEV